jgi:hypothetical protein
MVLQNWILPFLIGIVATYLLMSILYHNSLTFRQNFSDLGALIQLQTSRPVYYANWIPENQNVYNDVMQSYGIQQNTMNIGIPKDLNQGYPMVYPIPYQMAYPEDYPVQYPPMKMSGNPHVKINNA